MPKPRFSPVVSLLGLWLGGASAALAGQEGSLRTKPEQELPAWAKENIARIDPQADQWRSEVLHDAAKPHFKHFLEDLAFGKEFESIPFADDFRCTVLRPELETVYNDRTIAVRRAAAIPPEMHGREELPALAHAFRAMAGAGAQPGPLMMKLVSVDMDGQDAFRIRAYLHAHVAEAGAALQWNVEFESSWRVGATDQDVTLAGMKVLQYEEVSGPTGLLPDHSMTVFGNTPLYREQILIGTEDYFDRTDKIIGKSFIGAQGLAVGDVNGDGHDDVYFCQQSGLPNRLWLWRPDGVGLETSAAEGIDFLDKTRSALIADFDGDGFEDLAVSIGQDVAMCWNDGHGAFQTARVQGTGTEEIYSLSAADADNDGDLDLYACRYKTGGVLNAVPNPYYDATNGAPNIYWRNEGKRRLKVATDEVGFGQNNVKYSFIGVWEDIDDDGDQDLYVVNDFGRNSLYLNEGGKFREAAVERGCDDMAAGMGATFGDVDGDGDLDLYVTNMFSSAGRRIATQADQFLHGEKQELHQNYLRHARGNSLLLNDGKGAFTDVTDNAGVAVGLWGWGSLFFELDNDGLPDIYAPNGFLTGRNPTDL